MSKRVLITGGAGFIGSNLAARCVAEGFETYVVDDFSNGHNEFLPIGLHEVWRDDFAAHWVLGMIKTGMFDTVFHLAALPRVSYSVEFPVKTNTVNVSKTLELIDACKDNVKRFVFSSSSSVYGGAKELPTPETSPLNPQSPYALQKMIVEKYLERYNDHFGFDCCSLRYFNVFGPNQLGNSPYATAVSAWLTAIHKNESCRSDGDGTQSRDMCHVDNVVEANILAMKHKDKLNASVYNVACGDKVSNNEILHFLKNRFPEMKTHSAPWRAGDVMHTQANISLIELALDYKVQVRFWEGLERTIDWYTRNYKKLSKLELSI